MKSNRQVYIMTNISHYDLKSLVKNVFDEYLTR